MNDAADAGTEEAQGSNGQTEGLATVKAIFGFVDGTIVHCLSGTLAVAEGQQHTGSGEKALNHQCSNHGNGETNHSLQQIRSNGGDTGVEDLHSPLLVQLTLGGLECGSNETQSQGMVSNNFHGGVAVATKEGGVKQHVAGNGLIDAGNQQQNAAAQHRGGNQRSFQKFEGLLETVCKQKA